MHESSIVGLLDLCPNTRRVTDRGKRIKTINEVKSVKKIN